MRLNDDGYDSFDNKWIRGPTSKEELIYYGSDSHDDLDSFGDIENDVPMEMRNEFNDTKEYQDFLFEHWKSKNLKEGEKKVAILGESESDSDAISEYD